MGTEPEYKIWGLTGFGAESEVLVFGVNFSDSIHPWWVLKLF